jgi:hypothetical protein
VLFPVLQRFYGGGWSDWEGLPIKMLNCYISMMPVIKAEESLLLYQATACGVGPRNRAQSYQMRKQVREWVKTMRRFSGQQAPTRKAKDFEEYKAALAGMGLRVKEAARG